LKTLIIRTDKLGDIYITLPYIKSLIKKFEKENIDLVLSESIYDHFKNKEYLFNKVYSYPKNGFFKKLLLLIKLRSKKYQNIIVFDGKDKSIILSIILRSVRKFIFIEKRKINFILKIIFLNKYKYKLVINNKLETYGILFERLINLLDVKFDNNDFNFLKYENLIHFNLPKNIENNLKSFTMIHLDEKWFSKLYIKDFTDINPSEEDFLNFIKEFINKKEKTLVVTTGKVNLSLINKLCTKKCTKINDYLFELNHNNCKALFFLNTNMRDLEILTMNSNNLITCQGPLTHVAFSFNINVIDIIEKRLENWYNRHVSKKINYNKVFRKDFKDLKNDILANLK